MKIDLNVLSEKQTETTVNQTKMRLSENAASMVFQMFTKNIYSNPIGTVVREITSNCFDSHVEANVKALVLIKKSFDNQTQTHYISFIDYGMGMSPDRVENIYAVYFESTKRSDNQQIGGFGIGAKSVLAYKRSTGHGQGEYDNSFYVITVFNKMKYYYCIFEGQESPVISLLHSEPTNERNGTEVRIPVLEKDLNSFSSEMIRQLYYFENIIFEGFDDNDILTNEYQIIRGKNFLYRGNECLNTMHVCLGRVAYPIDYNVLGLNSSDYNLPLALKLEVGDINVVASREQLDYSENTIKVLKKKLEEAKAEIIDMLNKQYDNIVTLKDYFNFQNDFGVLTFPNGVTLSVGSLIKKKDIDLTNFKYSFLAMPNDRELFNFFFETKKYGKKIKSRYCNRENFTGYNDVMKRTDAYYIENEFVRKVAKASYLNSEHGTYFIISRRNLLHGYMRTDIAQLFNVHLDNLVDTNGKPVAYVQNLLDMQEEYFDIIRENLENYDTIEVPAEFLVRRKKLNVLSAELRNTTISAKLFNGYDYNTKIKLDSLFKFKEPIFYGTTEDKYKLSCASTVFNELFDGSAIITSGYSYNSDEFNRNSKKGIIFIMLSKSNLKHIKYCRNAYHVDQFYNKMLYRKIDEITTNIQTIKIIEKYDSLNSLYKNEQFVQINDKWGNLISEVNNYIENLSVRKKDYYYIKDKLSQFVNIANIPLTDEQKKINMKIERLEELEKKNRNVLHYLSSGFFYNLDITLTDILKKIMIFN
ncbi:hypothetical protein M0Q97_09660 [Candidatus Dojkabacteria bacterium]|jgi:hypothetical protein|nr:hypothetical protein [Candidatus Dojkabacteria bacterium]